MASLSIIQSYAITISCIAGQPIQIAMASQATLDPGTQYSLKLVNAGPNTPVAIISLDASDVPVIPDLPSHAAETSFQWPVKSVATSPDWPSSLYYSVVLADGSEVPGSRAYFVIRLSPETRINKILIHWPSATIHAYAGNFGDRTCLYDSTEQLRGRRVTTQRPLDQIVGPPADPPASAPLPNGQSAQLWQWLQQLAHASKNASYRADVCSSWDLDSDPDVLTGYRILILAGHDEYWSKPMRDRVEAFVAAGGHVANFSGNTAWWQIRFINNGSVIQCYKNALEDPLLGSDMSQVTCNWATDPPNRPENTLTGVSFRYGWPVAYPTNYTRVPNPPKEANPVWDGVVHPEGFGGFENEVDGIELDFSDEENPKPTYRDGTPDTFALLAYNPPIIGGGPERHTVIGYYTNIGTVFSCPVFTWIDQLTYPEDPMPSDVQVLTRNVIAWLLDRGNSTAIGPSRAIVPPPAWTSVETGTFTALTASFQGRVFVAALNQVWVRHQDMLPGWEPVTLPTDFVGTITAMGSNLYGTNILVCVGNGLYVLTAENNSLTYTAPPATPAGPGEHFIGIACSDQGDARIPNGVGAYYALIGTQQSNMELRVLSQNRWYAIGDGSGLSSLAACDGYLLATTVENRLVARMGGILTNSPAQAGEPPNALICDTTWVDIGEANDISALTHLFGRLYALAGGSSKALQWRSLRPDADRLPVDHGKLLFYNQDMGSCAFGIFRQNGDYEDQGSFSAGMSWTHVVRVNDGMILFYNSINGNSLLGRVDPSGSWSEIGRSTGAFSPWDIVLSNGNYTLFYNRTGSGTIGRFNPATGDFDATESRDDYSPSWSVAAATWGIVASSAPDRGQYIVFYSDDGRIAIGEITENGTFRTLSFGKMMPGADHLIAAGQLGLFAYDSNSGRGEFGEVLISNTPTYVSRGSWTDFATGWILGPARNGLVLFYSSDGAGVAGGFSREGIFQPLNTWEADSGGFNFDWSHIVGF